MTERLSNDTCRCHDEGCPVCNDCQRFTDTGEGDHVVHMDSMFQVDGMMDQRCPYQIPMEGETK